MRQSLNLTALTKKEFYSHALEQHADKGIVLTPFLLTTWRLFPLFHSTGMG